MSVVLVPHVTLAPVPTHREPLPVIVLVPGLKGTLVKTISMSVVLVPRVMPESVITRREPSPVIVLVPGLKDPTVLQILTSAAMVPHVTMLESAPTRREHSPVIALVPDLRDRLVQTVMETGPHGVGGLKQQHVQRPAAEGHRIDKGPGPVRTQHRQGMELTVPDQLRKMRQDLFATNKSVH